ncbi:hypothetical protein [Coxiella-like endosymbiont]|uniref:hypothetical protein n=1 Tax=Coxiella-like endosymbiont TaxID=1592897 RepID=UPI002811CA8C|nr:hypothetical protein [Coxiella-like endosymbiont]
MPESIDYNEVAGLSNEVRQKLSQIRPTTLGQATRIPGITPAAISLLLIYLKRRSKVVLPYLGNCYLCHSSQYFLPLTLSSE